MKLVDIKKRFWKWVVIGLATLGTGLASAQKCAEEKAGISIDKMPGDRLKGITFE